MDNLPDLPLYPLQRAAGCPLDPPPELAEWQREDPIKKVRLWNRDSAWVVTRFADQSKLLADPRISADANREGFPHAQPSAKALKQLGRVIISLDGAEHTRVRRMFTRDFTVRAVESKRTFIQQVVDRLIDDLLAGPAPVDLMSRFAVPVPSLVICDLLGVPYDAHDDFQDLALKLVSPSITEVEAREAITGLRSYIDNLIDVKVANRADDVVSHLVEFMIAGELTREDVVNNGFFLLIAGHETTTNNIALGILALLCHPEQLASLNADPSPARVASAVEELMRYLHTQHAGRPRIATDDIEIGGHVICRGDGIITAGNIADRDPAAFVGDPDSLDIDRPARHHTAFGYGSHQCLGQPLARLELQIAIGTLARRIPTLRLAVPFEDLRFKLDSLGNGVDELPVIW